MTLSSGLKRTRLPTSVFIVIIAVQSVGVLCTALLVKPSTIKRNDGRHLAVFKQSTWLEDLKALPGNVLTPKLLLLTPAFTASQTVVSFAGSLNGFYFNARTRTLNNVCLNHHWYLSNSILSILTHPGYLLGGSANCLGFHCLLV